METHSSTALLEVEARHPPGQPAPQALPATRPGHGAAARPTNQSLVWIASYPKSGNTWVRAFLHNLTREMAGETEGAQDINAMHRHTHWEILDQQYEAILGRKPLDLSREEVARARPEVQRRLAAGRKAPVLVKTHLCHTSEYGVPTINLEATFAAIYIVRNPLDVALSYAHHTGHAVDWIITQMAQPEFRTLVREKAVSELVGSWSRHAGSWMGLYERPVHVLRYEDLLRDPIKYFGGLARFLRLAPTAAQLEAAIEKSSFAELRRQEEASGFRETIRSAARFFREGREGQWREHLTAKQVARTVRAHAPMMMRFGYMRNSQANSLLRPQSSSR